MSKDSILTKISVPFFFILTFCLHYIALNQTQYANGWDGYYYIMQVHSFLEKGTMRSPDYSLIYPYYIILSYLIKDYILAYKIGTAILSGILIISGFIISQNSYKNKTVPFLVSAFLAFSPTLYFFASQFPKNLQGIIFFLWFIYFLSNKKMLWAGFFFLLGFITHRMIAGLSIIILFFSIIKGYKIKYAAPIVALALLIVLLLPGIIHFSDLERFSNFISDSLYLPPFRLINFFGKDKISIAWTIEILSLYILFIVSFILVLIEFSNKKNIENYRLYLIIVLLVLSLPIYTFSKASIGFRFYLVFNILSVLIIPYAIKFLPDFAKIISVSILLLASFFSYKSYNPNSFDPPYESYFIINDKAKSFLEGQETELIIAHQSLAQIIIVYSDYDATNWQPIDSSKYNSMWRIASNIQYYYFKKYINKNELKYLNHLYNGYYILREDVWQKFHKRVLKSNDQDLINKINSWYNPTKPKPEYLLNRRSKDYVH